MISHFIGTLASAAYELQSMYRSFCRCKIITDCPVNVEKKSSKYFSSSLINAKLDDLKCRAIIIDLIDYVFQGNSQWSGIVSRILDLTKWVWSTQVTIRNVTNEQDILNCLTLQYLRELFEYYDKLKQCRLFIST